MNESLFLSRLLISVLLYPRTLSVCPLSPDLAVFTCITDTRALVWRETLTNDQEFFDTSSAVNDTKQLGEFTVQLVGVSGSIFNSTATLANASVFDGTLTSIVIFCADNAQGQEELNATLTLAGMTPGHGCIICTQR